MPVLTSGSSTTVTLGDYDSITLQNRPGQQASITVAGTLVNGAHSGTRTYGPYNSGTSVSITATVGDLYYEVADGVAPSTPGSGSGSVAVQDEGTQVAASAAHLNFRGAGVSASSDGAGGVNVDVPGTASITPRYLAFFPLDQPVSSGIPRDITPNVKSMYRMSGLTDAACWANRGWATTGAGTNLGLILNQSDVDLSATDTRNIVVAFEMQMATPGATTAFAGWSAGSGFGGLIFSATSSGKLTVSVRTAANTAVTSAATVFNVADGAVHAVMVVIDNVSNYVRIFVDGYYAGQVNYGTTGAHHTVPQGSDFGLGAAFGDDQTTVAAQFRNLHLLALPEVPVGLGALARQLAGSMGRMIFNGEV